MVFQEDTVFPWMTVQQNIEFGLRAQNRPPHKRKREAARWLEAVGLARFGESWPKELSGGMHKRVAIAAVFAGGAPILLMDEPFGPRLCHAQGSSELSHRSSAENAPHDRLRHA